ncbi:MAG TPA: hypothetical protein VN792_05815 [Candidatus Acidoferrales bacterium]|nr:hypothetical protein [Candidatus Acidoferrales bacterium]
MRIDRTHKSWLVASLAMFGVSLLLYGFYRVPFAAGSMGGTGAGLAFGAAGFAFMIFAALLGARKRVPVYRFGRAQTWMRGHLWLGLLSLPLILFHSGFRYGHGLTAWLMTLLIVVVVSGIFGTALQHYMPRVMTREVTMETIYEEIAHVRAQLLEETEELIKEATGGNKKAAAEGGEADSAAPAVVVMDEAAPLRNFFEQELKPFLEMPGRRGSALGDAAQANSAFAQLRTLVPASLHGTIEDLEGICEEERQLTLQSHLHVWLHGWLLLHIPLSLALILLGAIHAVMALPY